MELLPFSNIILPVAGNVPNMGFIYRINQIKPGKTKKVQERTSWTWE